ncbi:MAG: PorT family protein [Prevotellaceae bacterium]|jgi:hypothetical protein|nr:PorT family protein [Prevotellaceae bacterium]
MRKYGVMLAVVFLLWGSSSAQMLSLGLKGGGSIASQEIKGYNADSKTSFHAGILGNLYLVEIFHGGIAIQPELLFNRKGSVMLPFGTDKKGGKYITINYLEIPLGISYIFIFRHVLPYISFAPYVAYSVYNKVKISGDADISPLNFPEANIKRFDYGLKFGAGMEVKRFLLSASYSMGLNNISKENVNIRNSSIEVSLGYYILQW